MTVRETVQAHKQKFHAADLDALFAGATRVLVASGKSATAFRPGKDSPEAIAAKALGRSGTLRAPAVRAGKTWLIGFHDGAWTDVLT